MKLINRLKYAITNEISNDDLLGLVTETIGLNPSIEEINKFFHFDCSIGGSSLNSATYYSCMLIRCNAIAKLPIKLMKHEDGGSKKDVKHPLYNLLGIRPNAYMTPHDFLWATEFQRLHYGNSYWIPEYKNGEITALHLADSKLMEIIIDNKAIINTTNGIYYIYNRSQNKEC